MSHTRKTYPTAAFLLLVGVLLCRPITVRCEDDSSQPNAEDLEFFETRIRPILVEHCYECHAANSKVIRGGLQVDSREALRKGGDNGPAVRPGKPAESPLIEALKYEELQMPPKGKLPDAVIADFVTWIKKGAIDPRVGQLPSKLKPVDWEAAARHWAFQRVAEVVLPEVSSSKLGWEKSPVDCFIASKLQRSDFPLPSQADKPVLIRRASFDLIGLPPTPADVHAFLADKSPDAYERVIDRLLASPHYGERWGRHWLDLVRYADTNGADENHALPNAWRYRDWVVQKLNSDLPIDDFLVQQLAGDLLPAPSDEQAAGDLLAATGMLVIGPKMLAEQDKDKMLIDIVDEQVDTVSRTMLGLTIGCARCHDHKFDPISARDYYALAGIFYSTQSMADRAFVSKWMERPRPSQVIEAERVAYQPRIDEAKAKLAQLKEARAQATEPITDEEIKAQEAALEKVTKEMPAFEMVMAVQEDKPKDLPIHIRGNHLTLTPDAVPRAMPVILTNVHPGPVIESGRSGRMELAQWLVSAENPLTTRVMVNRLWMWHFGKAIVRSPSNFGLQAEPPTHPELLDWLARELTCRNWSLKEMHRRIMHSATYQATSAPIVADEQRDPENRMWRRQNRRRLEAEPIRDSILFLGGELDLTLGKIAANTEAKRRAIYMPINRSALYEMFSTFDYVETANHIEQRSTTTVPQQALFMLNSPLVIGQASSLAKDVLQNRSTSELGDERATIGDIFQRLYSRLPADSEVIRAQKFLEDAKPKLASIENEAERWEKAWAALCATLIAANEFIYVE